MDDYLAQGFNDFADKSTDELAKQHVREMRDYWLGQHVFLHKEVLQGQTVHDALAEKRRTQREAALGVSIKHKQPEGIQEGFPDITTTAIERGYSSNETLRNGYILFEHVKIDSENTTDYKIVNYYNRLGTEYYYTCEADGTVRQFNSSEVVTAQEYMGWEASVVETRAVVDVRIYSKTFK